MSVHTVIPKESHLPASESSLAPGDTPAPSTTPHKCLTSGVKVRSLVPLVLADCSLLIMAVTLVRLPSQST